MSISTLEPRARAPHVSTARAALLTGAELLVVVVASLAQPFGCDLLRDRAVRLLRGMNQRAVLEGASSSTSDGAFESTTAVATSVEAVVAGTDGDGVPPATSLVALVPAAPALPDPGSATLLRLQCPACWPANRPRAPGRVRGPPLV